MHDMELSKTVADRIRAARVACGLSQGELATCIDWERTNVCRMETGRHSPSAETLVRLSKSLGVSSDYLLGLSDTP